MINPEKKQFVEMGERLRDDTTGAYRKELKNRVRELSHKTEKRLQKDPSSEEKKQLEALQRAFIVADRILEKVFTTPQGPEGGELYHSQVKAE